MTGKKITPTPKKPLEELEELFPKYKQARIQDVEDAKKLSDDDRDCL